ncbi:MAG: aminoglycoside phosphotransferase family protein [Thermodesulfovibrionales bacterium]|nr:aminoglycoside phosphotransferase family protein [Thermodesulfovibrionales bacterium]
MKIEQLLQREPFGDIIENTLSQFLTTYLKTPYRCTWKKLGILKRITANSVSYDGEVFFCNPYLNILFPKNAGPLIFDFVRDNYLHTPFRHRRLIQKLYVNFASHPYTSLLLATNILNIHPKLPDSRDIVILGGNNRIRIIDLRKMRTWDILKTSFDQSYMAAELAARNQPGEWPFPKLHSVGEDGTWFESEYIPAVSLNRIDYKDSDTHLVKQALQFLGEWLNLSVAVSSVKEYAECLIAQIESAYKGKGHRVTDSELLQQFIDGMRELLKIHLENASSEIILAHGHGDFQHGNILVDTGGKVWVIDWEHAGQRQIAYDYLVFALKSRFPYGLSLRIKVALENPDALLSKLPTVHEKFQTPFMDERRRPVILLVFLFEELLWNFRENANPLFSRTSGALPQLMAEISPCLQSIRSFLK